ncbi:MAG: phosphate acyltransferase PlsX [Bacteroidales bacterium]|jgi:glycerol-3-phosphate acyltransferase PlsX|nr:phosphate acyltransferase PlsX [Bacteroidales bacterium]
MNIGLDVMGGDFAPKATVKGACLALHEISSADKIFLIGPEEVILEELAKEGVDPGRFVIINAPEVIGMGEHPTRAVVQKPNSSISIGFHLLKHGKIDAFSSAGNSGAMVVGSMYSVNTIQGIIRPCTSAVVPKENGTVSILLDVGTITDVKPEVMYQFGILGSLYAEHIFKIPNPRVGLLNLGAEEEKGNLQCQASFAQMKNSRDFNFIGNVEGRDIFKDKADVIVCDGFTGNVVLKLMESFYRILVKRNLRDEYIDRMNYENYGGTPLLGINSSVIVGHGISNDIAIKNMILLSKEVHEVELSIKIQNALQKFSLNNKE